MCAARGQSSREAKRASRRRRRPVFLFCFAAVCVGACPSCSPEGRGFLLFTNHCPQKESLAGPSGEKDAHPFHFPSARVRWRSPTGARRAASVLEGRLPTRAYPQSTPAPHAASFATADEHSPTHRQRCLAAPADGPPSPSRLQWDLEQRVASIVDSTLKDISQRYKIQEELGAGAQATVYKATHKRNHMKARPLRTPPAAAARVSQRAASPAGRHQGDRDQGA